MSDISYRPAEPALISEADPSDFFALLKPRVMSLVVFTALVGLMAAPGSIHPFMGMVAILAIAVGAGAAGALNMWYDADIDRIMGRTARRPIPAGKVTGAEALGFGLTLSAFSVVTLGLATNWFAAAFLAFTIFFYAVVYTMWLKRWTAQNIVIGGASGAFPPMIGWAAVTGGVSIDSFLLFLIIFIWTPPHFWALALVKSEDYARAGVPMLPVVAGPDATRLQILLYTLLLVPTGLAPLATGLGSTLYGAVAVLGGIGMLVLAVRIFLRREGKPATRACWQMFGFSIVYLFGLFAALLAEKLLYRFLGWSL
jgi:protoheme IX farnesyltransferase